MAIKYEEAPDMERRVRAIAERLGMDHIDFSRLKIFRSRGSTSRRTLARCHGLPKILQMAMGIGAHYAIEIIGEKFDKLSEEEQTKTIIHELLHIPKNFGGGFRYHDYVCSRNVEAMYRKLRQGV
jgi:predicted metallopeptidase